MRRVICDVRKYGYEGPSGKCLMKTFSQRTIEVRDKGNHHIRTSLFPALFEHLDRGLVVNPNCKLQDLHKLRAAEGVPRAQHGIVEILNADSRVFLENVQFIEHFLQIHELDDPTTVLGLNG